MEKQNSVEDSIYYKPISRHLFSDQKKHTALTDYSNPAAPRARVFIIRASGYYYHMDFAHLFSHPLIICLIVFAVMVEIWVVWKTTAANKSEPVEQAPRQTESHFPEPETDSQGKPGMGDVEALARALEDLRMQLMQDRESDRLKFEDLNNTIRSLENRLGQRADWEQRMGALEQEKALLLSRIQHVDDQLKVLAEKHAKIRRNPVLKTLNDLLGR